MANGDMSLTLSGSKLPVISILVGLAALVSSIVLATIWLTRLDERVLLNTGHIAEISVMVEEHDNAMVELQMNSDKQTYILDHLIERLDENGNEHK